MRRRLLSNDKLLQVILKDMHGAEQYTVLIISMGGHNSQSQGDHFDAMFKIAIVSGILI
jgi:hypothetical protein